MPTQEELDKAREKSASSEKKYMPPTVNLVDAKIRQKWIEDTSNGDTNLTYPEYVYKYRDQLPR